MRWRRSETLWRRFWRPAHPLAELHPLAHPPVGGTPDRGVTDTYLPRLTPPLLHASSRLHSANADSQTSWRDAGGATGERRGGVSVGGGVSERTQLMTTQCRYCRSSSYGRGCSYSPHKAHEHTGTADRCEFCGSSSYGRGCSYSPTTAHRHGQDGRKCRWCGSGSVGRGCSYAPTGAHER